MAESLPTYTNRLVGVANEGLRRDDLPLFYVLHCLYITHSNTSIMFGNATFRYLNEDIDQGLYAGLEVDRDLAKKIGLPPKEPYIQIDGGKSNVYWMSLSDNKKHEHYETGIVTVFGIKTKKTRFEVIYLSKNLCE